MRSQLVDHFRQQRKERGLSLAELARHLGYKNATKGCNKIQKFEQRGEIHADLLRKMADSLGIDKVTIDTLIEQDRRKFVRVWNEWADQPIQPRVAVRLTRAFYKSVPLPWRVPTLEEAEAFAAETARRWNKRACLTWSRRLSVWFDSKGDVEARTEAAPGEANVPTMRLKGSTRSFVLEDPSTGRTVLRLTDWPKQPTAVSGNHLLTNQPE
jgi:transcriptional regulator with XRE-family HTH domain